MYCPESPTLPDSQDSPDSIDSLDSPDSQARADVAAFERVGARGFDVSIIGEVKLDGEREFVAFTRNLSVEKLRRTLPALIWKCEREALNLIIRPRAPADTSGHASRGHARRLIQLDDLDLAAVEKLHDIAFRIVETSDGNFQAWLAVLGADEEMERRLKESVGADAGANGATRIAGSMNVKEQRRRADGSYPRVKLWTARAVTPTASDLAALVGRDEDMPPCVSSFSSSAHTQLLSPLPDYDEFVKRARLAATGEIDRSMVDFAWAATAIRRGFAKEVVASELERVSLKAAQLAKGTRARYVKRTVRAAARESG
ncbi:MAG: DNA-primase RepB domain-containing protein [Acidobacteriota bacterium]